MSIVTKINPKALEAISLFCAKEETRYNMTGIFCEVLPNETRLVATDGISLGIYREPRPLINSECGSCLIPKDAITTIKSHMKALTDNAKTTKGVFDVSLTITNKTDDDKILYIRPRLTFSIGFKSHCTSFETSSLEGRFPEYLNAFPNETTDNPCCFDPDRLIVMAKAAKILTGSPVKKNIFYTLCNLHTSKKDDCGMGIITINGIDNFTGLICHTIPANPQSLSKTPNTWWLPTEASK